jgi:hypothetical protein
VIPLLPSRLESKGDTLPTPRVAWRVPLLWLRGPTHWWLWGVRRQELTKDISTLRTGAQQTNATEGVMRTVTGVLSSRVTSRDIKIDGFSMYVAAPRLSDSPCSPHVVCILRADRTNTCHVAGRR